jgi:peptidyl-tRNA hydrolase, PTH1 family
MAIRLIIGLGNPGQEYSKTRHNAGFWFLDALAEATGTRLLSETKLHAFVGRAEIAGQKVLLAKPTTFMNKSALASQALQHFYKIEASEMLVAHDELDLAPGTARLKFDGGHGGQNGLRDIIGQLGHGKFHRLRVGIGHPGHKDQVTSWVLGRANVDQEKQIQDSISAARAVVDDLVLGHIDRAMKNLHTKI